MIYMHLFQSVILGSQFVWFPVILFNKILLWKWHLAVFTDLNKVKLKVWKSQIPFTCISNNAFPFHSNHYKELCITIQSVNMITSVPEMGEILLDLQEVNVVQ